ncbi:MAG: hypothetical protein DPW09_38905 [Anaerolineae bacterium]|nr:AAA family ATPase [Anaerolineales bacterium]MCQ3979427.1 hypothetical protein [Anaerolineae bacterium]
MESLDVFIPSDRRRAMALGESLPDRAHGTALFADISGFTPLTEALVKELGPRQGIDELTQQLNRVYDAIIAEVDRCGGSVIFFSGDAITCWFDDSERMKAEGGRMKEENSSFTRSVHPSAFRAVFCALQMQQAMLPFAAITTPSGVQVSLGIKVAVAAGPVRRFLVGNPAVQLLDVLAGQTLDRMARMEHLAQKGEILVGPEIVAQLGNQLEVTEWRVESEAKAEAKEQIAVITGLTFQPSNLPTLHPPTPPTFQPSNPPTLQPSNLPTFQPSNLPTPLLRSWLQPAVYERLKAGGGRFLAELRSAVALFISFHGLDYDEDDAAGDKLDAYIRWVQDILSRYDGTILQLTIGDKGSYMYLSFGAPVSHGDDASWAVAAALELRDPPQALNFIGAIRMGLSQGRMRAGAYGSQTRRTYGVLGSEANMAARLMSRAAPGQILASKQVAEAAAKNFQFAYLETSPVKGRTEPIPMFEVVGRQAVRPYLMIPAPAENKPFEWTPLFDAVLAGQGQVARLDSPYGPGQENPLAALKRQALERGFQIGQGSCQEQVSYSPWREIFRARFGLAAAPQEKEDRTAWTKYQISQVETAIAALNPDWLPLLPLLGDLLDLPIPDNDTTTIFNPLLRQGTLFALVMEMVKTWAASQPYLLIIEAAHRLDESAQGLTLAVARSLTSMPVLLVLAHPPSSELPETLGRDLSRLPHYHYLSGQTRPAVASKSGGWLWTGTSPLAAAPLIGRSTERMLLTGQLQALLRGNAGGAVLIEGEAGIGKSRLVADLLQQAQAQGVTCLIGGGEAIEQSTPYHAWRPLFRQLFNLDNRPHTSPIPPLLASRPDLSRLAPLLNTLLPLGLPETELTRQMTGQVRADNTRDLLLTLLQEATAQSPALLVLEDAHWLDSASWALTRLVSQRVPNALLIVATRPLTAPLPVEYSQLLQTPGLQQIKLEAMSPEETLALVCQRLGVKTLPDPVATLIRAKAEGHPFFSEELAYALRDSGLIQIEAGECKLVPQMGAFGATILPDTVEEVITSRIDRLNPAQQIILKVASVIGRTFLVELLRDIHPNQAEKPRLPAHLGTLAQLDITRLDNPEPDLTYTFKHAITREVAYNLMLFDQRRDLHRAVAEWVEQTYADNLPAFYALLAHHWSQALGDRSDGVVSINKAIDYLEKAGEQALRGYANQEAVRFLSEAIAVTETHLENKQGGRGAEEQRGRVSPAPLPLRSPALLRRARWERQLGEAYLGLGQLAESRTHLGQAVARLGWPQPGQRSRQISGLLGQLLQQIWHRVWPANRGATDPERRASLLEAARTYERLGEVYYWSNETLAAIYAALRTLNLAEQAGPSPELARAYANMCLVAGFASLRGLAETYSRRAQAAAQSAQPQPALAWVLELTGVYALGVGQWAKARDTLNEGARVAQQLEDRRRWAECFTALGDIAFFQGNFSQSLALWPEVTASARRRGDAQAQAWGLAGQLRSLLALGELETPQLQTTLQTLEQVAREDIGSADKINAYGVIALARWRLDQVESAQAAVEIALHWIAQSSPTGFGVLHGYSNAAEVCLALWEAGERLEIRDWRLDKERLKSNVEQTCDALRRYGRAFPIGQPRAWLSLGSYQWLAGQHGQARKAWKKSLAAAERLAMPYEQAQALYELGRHLPVHDSNRRVYLSRAIEIFSQLSAKYDLARARMVLDESF